MAIPLLAHPLSEQLRERTSQAHENAEGSDFMSELLAGRASVAAYAELSAQLYFVYDALETASRRHATGELFSRLHDPRLERINAISSDLEELLGASWRSAIEPLPATARYVARLEEADELSTIGHHYVRYLGDIAGGQVIAAMMQRHYGIDPSALSFYDFSHLGKIKRYRDQYREALDSLDLSEAQNEAVVEAAIEAFGLNFEVFSELTARL